MSDRKDYNSLREHVLKTLMYFDIFSYPLKASEVFRFLRVGHPCQEEVAECLNTLAASGHVFRFGEFYSLHENEQHVRRRVKGNEEAEKWTKVARTKARFIAKFPFVRAVMASGSLSKGYMDEKSDLDFFVVTAPGRLWIARTLLVLYKRLFLFNSHKHFCINYFVDQDHLEIEEKNLFTATEVATLLPLHNHTCYETLISRNRWIRTYLPNFVNRSSSPPDGVISFPLQAVFEKALNPLAGSLDRFFMRLSQNRWKRLYADKYRKEDFDIAFKTRKDVSKNHPNNYQKKILELYDSKLVEFRHRFTELTAHE